MQRPLSGLAVPRRWLILLTISMVVLCCLPAVLMVGGANFGNMPLSQNLSGPFASQGHMTQALYAAMRGSLVHSLLEWSAFCVAVVIALAAILHYSMNGQTSTPVISLVLLSAGTMDAFHVLAADHLIPSIADNHEFIPFTWALSRFFNAAITIIGVGLLTFTQERKRRGHAGLILCASLLFASIGSLLVLGCARYDYLPVSIFPDQFISRPWDIPALVLFILAAIVVIPSALQKHRNVFLLTIWISMIPQIATQLYMVFGSRGLYDSAFNIAHSIKIVAYVTPLCGLCVDYVLLHKQLEQSVRHIRRSRSRLRLKHDHLQAVLVNIGDAVLTVDRNGNIKTVNRATLQLFGYDMSHFAGMNISQLLYQMPISFTAIGQEMALSDHPLRTAYLFEATGMHSQEHGFDVEVSVNRLNDTPDCDFVVSIHDCTQIRNVTRELANARDQAHLAAEARDHLLSNVSFELRTPLNAILGFAGLLEEELRGLQMADLVEDASEIRIAGTHLQEMIHEMLDLATLNEGKLNINIEPIKIKSLCHDVLQASLGTIEASNNIIHLHCSYDTLTVHSDMDRLRQILFSLVSNAARLTQDSRIDMHVEQADFQQRPGVAIRIVAAGVCLPQTQQNLIFEIFGNTSEPSHPMMGSGTGLSLSQRLVNLLGGQISLTCDEQQGTTFHILLPLDGPELEPVSIDQQLDPVEVEAVINER